MSIRKRSWKTSTGERRSSWVADYIDGSGGRHVKTFSRKADATAALAEIMVAVKDGKHTPASRDITVAEGAKRWLASCEAAGLERSTRDAYQQHVDLHLVPFIGRVKLAQITPPAVRDFEDRLRRGDPGTPRSPAMVKRVVGSLGAILADAQERGLVTRNAVREMRSNRRRGSERRAEKRAKGKLVVGRDIPIREEIKAIVGALDGRWRPFMLVAIFTGLRASELRGLRWADVDLVKRELHVRQRADRYKAIGRPKSASGERTVPFSAIVLSALREHKMAAAANGMDLVFATKAGGVEYHSNVVKRALWPAQVAAGVTVRAIDANGTPRSDAKDRPIMVAKYSGMHALRHFYASWCINRPEDGGLGLPLKVVQVRMGHSTITMTADVYSHLFKQDNVAAQMDAAERSLLA